MSIVPKLLNVGFRSLSKNGTTILRKTTDKNRITLAVNKEGIVTKKIVTKLKNPNVDSPIFGANKIQETTVCNNVNGNITKIKSYEHTRSHTPNTKPAFKHKYTTASKQDKDGKKVLRCNYSENNIGNNPTYISDICFGLDKKGGFINGQMFIDSGVKSGHLEAKDWPFKNGQRITGVFGLQKFNHLTGQFGLFA